MERNVFNQRGPLRQWKALICLLGFLAAACTSLNLQPLRDDSGSETATSPPATAVPSLTPSLTATPTPTLTPSPTAATPRAGWPEGQTLLVNRQDGAWLRQVPDSRSERILRVLALGATVIVSAPPYYDGVQWWWLVSAITGDTGWLEQSALSLTASQNWQTGTRLVISKTQGAWLRGAPSSASDDIIAVLPQTTPVTVSGEPQDDGVQWWWPVTARGGHSGWVEQDALTVYVAPAAPPPRTPLHVVPVQPPFTVPIQPIQPIDQPVDIPPPNQPPQQPPAERPPVVAPPPAPTRIPPVEFPPVVTATQPPPNPTIEQPPEFPATPDDGTVEFPVTVVAIEPSAAPKVVATPAAETSQVMAGALR